MCLEVRAFDCARICALMAMRACTNIGARSHAPACMGAGNRTAAYVSLGSLWIYMCHTVGSFICPTY